MANHINRHFRDRMRALPTRIRAEARSCYKLFKQDSQHPSLQLKRVGSYWSVRIGRSYRALAIEVDDGLLWFWIGPHEEYDRLLRKK